MDDYPQSAMIALLPTTTDWCKIKLPHMTLVYAGEVGKDVKDTDFNVLAKDAASIASMTGPLSVKVTGVETLGDEERVDALMLEQTTLLNSMRHLVERWNASQYKDFRPHCTIGPEGSFLEFTPMYLTFDRICVSWGKQLIPFWLKQYT